MLDTKVLRNEFARVEQALEQRGKSKEMIVEFPELDARRREMLQETEQLKNRRNVVSQEVAKKKKAENPPMI